MPHLAAAALPSAQTAASGRVVTTVLGGGGELEMTLLPISSRLRVRCQVRMTLQLIMVKGGTADIPQHGTAWYGVGENFEVLYTPRGISGAARMHVEF